MAPWADVLYACDARWWRVYGKEAERDFKGEFWSADKRLGEWVNTIEATNGQGLSTNPERIYLGLNSGYQAMNLAYLWGVARMILLGYDHQKTGGRLHHHGKHEGGLPNLGTLSEWVGTMHHLGQDLRQQGVRVINASRATAIKCFERMPIEQALREVPQ